MKQGLERSHHLFRACLSFRDYSTNYLQWSNSLAQPIDVQACDWQVSKVYMSCFETCIWFKGNSELDSLIESDDSTRWWQWLPRKRCWQYLSISIASSLLDLFVQDSTTWVTNTMILCVKMWKQLVASIYCSRNSVSFELAACKLLVAMATTTSRTFAIITGIRPHVWHNKIQQCDLMDQQMNCWLYKQPHASSTDDLKSTLKSTCQTV